MTLFCRLNACRSTIRVVVHELMSFGEARTKFFNAFSMAGKNFIEQIWVSPYRIRTECACVQIQCTQVWKKHSVDWLRSARCYRMGMKDYISVENIFAEFITWSLFEHPAFLACCCSLQNQSNCKQRKNSRLNLAHVQFLTHYSLWSLFRDA